MRPLKKQLVFSLTLTSVLLLSCTSAEQWTRWLDQSLTDGSGWSDDLSQACPPGEFFDIDKQFCVIDSEDVLGGEESDPGEGEWMNPPLPGGDEFTDDILAVYTVQGDQITELQFTPASDEYLAYHDDTQRHREIWDLFVLLIPLENREFVSGFIIFTDGKEELMAAVDQDPVDPQLWVLCVDIIDAKDTHELVLSLIHEFGHLLTLNAAQVPPDIDLFQEYENWELYEQAKAACPNLFISEGCSSENSYINVFFGRFWADIYNEWYDIDTEPDEDKYYARLDAFYLKYEDFFVSYYAVTNPGEDIAESWTAFITQDRPTGDTIAEQKILFFYNYPQLVDLRQRIIEGMR